MLSLAQQIRDEVRRNAPRLDELREEVAAERPSPGKWSRKEIVGHLIDSALNNHQRFVRALLQERVELPGYEQNGWVEVGAYQNRLWHDLVGLWSLLNVQLAHVLERVPEHKWQTPCMIGGKQAVTLRYLAEDYLQHMRHHLRQVFDESYRGVARTALPQ